jgi:hypothetical protein
VVVTGSSPIGSASAPIVSRPPRFGAPEADWPSASGAIAKAPPARAMRSAWRRAIPYSVARSADGVVAAAVSSQPSLWMEER